MFIQSTTYNAFSKTGFQLNHTDSLGANLKNIASLSAQFLQQGNLNFGSIQAVESIANLCPLNYGPAVYYARALRASMDYRVYDYSSDCTPLAPQGFVMAQVNEKTEKQISVYPNPASDQVTIVFNEATQTITSFVMVDIMGREVLNTSIAMGKNTYALPVNNLKPGVYMYSILTTTESKPLKQCKLVIVR